MPTSDLQAAHAERVLLRQQNAEGRPLIGSRCGFTTDVLGPFKACFPICTRRVGAAQPLWSFQFKYAISL